MFIPTAKGVLGLVAMEGRGFGTFDLAGFDIETQEGATKGILLESCPFVAESYSGPLVELQGMTIPATTVLATGEHSWKPAGDFVAGDTLMAWAAETGVLAPVTLATSPEASVGEGIRIRAGETGVIFGPGASGPWILGR